VEVANTLDESSLEMTDRIVNTTGIFIDMMDHANVAKENACVQTHESPMDE